MLSEQHWIKNFYEMETENRAAIQIPLRIGVAIKVIRRSMVNLDRLWRTGPSDNLRDSRELHIERQKERSKEKEAEMEQSA